MDIIELMVDVLSCNVVLSKLYKFSCYCKPLSLDRQTRRREIVGERERESIIQSKQYIIMNTNTAYYRGWLPKMADAHRAHPLLYAVVQ